MLMAVGDFHLGALMNYVPKLWKKQLLHLKSICDYAVKNDIGHVFLLGDLFDVASPPDFLKIALRRLLSKYRRTIHFHILIGNHDWEHVDNHALQILHDLGLTGLFNFTVYTQPEVIKVDGVRLFMCSHPHILDCPDRKVDWCLGHFAWNGASADNGFKVESGNSPKGRWILGDFHTHQKGSRYVYCGSVAQVTWREALPKGVVLFDKDDWHFKPFAPTYKLGVAEIETVEQAEELADDVLWSVRTMNGFLLPPEVKQKKHNIVHLTAARKQKDIRAKVLLAKEDSSLHKPFRLIKRYLQEHKSGLRPGEIKYAMSVAKKLYMQPARK